MFTDKYLVEWEKEVAHNKLIIEQIKINVAEAIRSSNEAIRIYAETEKRIEDDKLKQIEDDKLKQIEDDKLRLLEEQKQAEETSKKAKEAEKQYNYKHCLSIVR